MIGPGRRQVNEGMAEGLFDPLPYGGLDAVHPTFGTFELEGCLQDLRSGNLLKILLD
jgi:hypothetical protein